MPGVISVFFIEIRITLMLCKRSTACWVFKATKPTAEEAVNRRGEDACSVIGLDVDKCWKDVDDLHGTSTLSFPANYSLIPTEHTWKMAANIFSSTSLNWLFTIVCCETPVLYCNFREEMIEKTITIHQSLQQLITK